MSTYKVHQLTQAPAGVQPPAEFTGWDKFKAWWKKDPIRRIIAYILTAIIGTIIAWYITSLLDNAVAPRRNIYLKDQNDLPYAYTLVQNSRGQAFTSNDCGVLENAPDDWFDLGNSLFVYTGGKMIQVKPQVIDGVTVLIVPRGVPETKAENATTRPVQ